MVSHRYQSVVSLEPASDALALAQVHVIVIAVEPSLLKPTQSDVSCVIFVEVVKSFSPEVGGPFTAL